jgi:hypothetical protein
MLMIPINFIYEGCPESEDHSTYTVQQIVPFLSLQGSIVF